MKIIAHRGYSQAYPENTILAFEQALAAGATTIECDIQEADGEFYVFHDRYLQRLCNNPKKLNDLNREQIADLRIAKDHPIPTLDQLFSCIEDKAQLNLEIKYIDNVDALCKKIIQLRREYSTALVISSFHHPTLLKIRETLRSTRNYNDIQYAALIAHLPADFANYAHVLEMDVAAIDADLVTKDFVKSAHINGMNVWCYTVNDDETYEKLNSFKVDAIFTDDPVWGLAKV